MQDSIRKKVRLYFGKQAYYVGERGEGEGGEWGWGKKKNFL